MQPLGTYRLEPRQDCAPRTYSLFTGWKCATGSGPKPWHPSEPGHVFPTAGQEL